LEKAGEQGDQFHQMINSSIILKIIYLLYTRSIDFVLVEDVLIKVIEKAIE